MMKKILILIIAVAILSTGVSCNGYGDLPPDGKALNDSVVATVNGVKILRGQVEENLKMTLASAGMNMDMFSQDDETVQEYRKVSLNFLISVETMRQKAKELKVYNLTADEQKTVNDIYQKYYDDNIEQYKSSLMSKDLNNNNLTYDDIKDYDYTPGAVNAFKTYLETYQNYTLSIYSGATIFDKLKESKKEEYVLWTKLSDLTMKDKIKVTEQQIKDRYDSNLAEQETKYQNGLFQYEQDYLSNLKQIKDGEVPGTIFLYTPEGLRYVRFIKILFDQTTMTNLMDLEQQMISDRNSMTQCQQDINNAADENTLKTANDNYTKAQNSYNTSKSAYDTALTEASGKINDKMRGIYDQLKNGGDFMTLMKQYNEDNDIYYDDNGFLISAKTNTDRFPEQTVQQGMALKNVGDYSQPYYTSEGGNIVYYSLAVQSGTVTYDQARAAIEDQIYMEQRNSQYKTETDKWVKACKVEKYENILLAPLGT